MKLLIVALVLVSTNAFAKINCRDYDKAKKDWQIWRIDLNEYYEGDFKKNSPEVKVQKLEEHLTNINKQLKKITKLAKSNPSVDTSINDKASKNVEDLLINIKKYSSPTFRTIDTLRDTIESMKNTAEKSLNDSIFAECWPNQVPTSGFGGRSKN